jgi:hypothetical protein
MLKINIHFKKYLLPTTMLVFLGLLLAGVYLFAPIVSAESAVTKGLALSPVKTELNIAPGTSLDGVLTITNSTDKPMIVDMDAEEFSVIDQQYDYAFNAQSDVTKWVTFSSKEVNLIAGESEKVTFTVNVPLLTEPGGRYISLFASTAADTSDNGVSSRQSVGSLLYITVLGNVSRIGHLLSLNSPWVIGSNSTWDMMLQNTGTTHFHSRYNVQIKNLIGNNIVTKSSGDALILPSSVRAISDKLPSPQLPGIYKVIYTIGLGDNPAVVKIYYLLYMQPLTAIILIIIIAVLIYEILHHRRSKN